MVGWFTILVLSLIFLFTLTLLYHYPAKNTPILVYLLVFTGWFTSFGIIALIPYDIFLTTTTEGDEQLLLTAWIVVYWTAFGLCWLVLPLTEKFHTSGEFKFFAKLKSAIIRQLRSFLIIISLGILLTIYLYFFKNLTLGEVPKILVFMSNIWGLFLIVTLLGFGLVALPMNSWRQGSLDLSLKILQLRAVPLDETLIDSRYRLDQCVGKIVKLSNEILPGSPLRPFIEIILSKCPQLSLERQQALPVQRSAKPLGLKYLDLVALHKELNDLISENLRSDWYCLDRAVGINL